MKRKYAHNRPAPWLTITLVILSLSAVSCTSILYGRASRLQDEGRYSEAISIMQKVLAMEEEKGPEHYGLAKALNNLAMIYHDTGAYAQAEPLIQRALTITEKVLGLEHPDMAAVLDNRARLYQTTGSYTKAEPLFKRALVIREKVRGPGHLETATSLNNLSGLYHSMGAYAKAEPLLQRALAILEQRQGSEHPETALVLQNLAGLYWDMGAYPKAEPLMARTLTIFEKALGTEHPNTATALNNMAALYEDTGAYAKAELLMERALAIREKVLGPDHPHTAQILNNLAGLYWNTGAYATAEPLMERALTIREKILGLEHPDTTQTLGNLAELYRAMGAYAKSEPLYQQALAINEKVLGPEHPATATALNNLAWLYWDTEAYAKAEPLMERALAIVEKAKGPEHPETAKALNNLAQFNWTSGALPRALSLLSRVQTVEEQNLSTFFLSGSESRKQAYLAQTRDRTSQRISLSLLMPDRHARSLGFQSLLMTKGRVLDAMSDSIGRLRQSVKPEDRAILEELITVAQQRSTLIYQGIGNLKPEVYRQRLQELVARQEQLETDLSTRSAEFRKQRAPSTLSAVQAAIPNGTALIEWYRYHPFDPKAKNIQSRWGKPRYVAYVLQHKGEPVVVDVGEAETIDQLVHDFRTGLSDLTSTYVKDVAKELYITLLKPLQQHLVKIEHLLLSPDGALNLVPFAALMDETGTYLGSKKEITYLTSGRDLLRLELTSAGNSEAVIVADPDYGKAAAVVAKAGHSEQSTRSNDLDRGGLVFRSLPGTADEAKTLTILIKVSNDQVLTQARATEERFKQLHGPRILHVATHGFFLKDHELPAAALKQAGFSQDHAPVPLDENPLLRSGLALAGANQRKSGEKDAGF